MHQFGIDPVKEVTQLTFPNTKISPESELGSSLSSYIKLGKTNLVDLRHYLSSERIERLTDMSLPTIDNRITPLLKELPSLVKQVSTAEEVVTPENVVRVLYAIDEEAKHIALDSKALVGPSIIKAGLGPWHIDQRLAVLDACFAKLESLLEENSAG